MNNIYKFAATAVTAFFIGEAVGIARGNRHWLPKYNYQVHRNDVMTQYVEGISDYLEEVQHDPEAAMQRLRERDAFIQVLKDQI